MINIAMIDLKDEKPKGIYHMEGESPVAVIVATLNPHWRYRQKEGLPIFNLLSGIYVESEDKFYHWNLSGDKTEIKDVRAWCYAVA